MPDLLDPDFKAIESLPFCGACGFVHAIGAVPNCRMEVGSRAEIHGGGVALINPIDPESPEGVALAKLQQSQFAEYAEQRIEKDISITVAWLQGEVERLGSLIEARPKWWQRLIADGACFLMLFATVAALMWAGRQIFTP